MEVVHNEHSLLIYIYGRSGRGKTRLMKVITGTVRTDGKFVLCTAATTDLAALNHEGGTTAHTQ